MKNIAVVRVRGRVGIDHRLNDTMRMLGLTRINHCVVVGEAQLGMVKKCKDYLTWGEIDEATFAMMVAKRGMKSGNKRVSQEDFRKADFSSAQDFAKKFMNSESDYSKLGIKKVFRLHPPRKGYIHVKKLHPYGGLGYRGENMNDLVKRMI